MTELTGDGPEATEKKGENAPDREPAPDATPESASAPEPEATPAPAEESPSSADDGPEPDASEERAETADDESAVSEEDERAFAEAMEADFGATAIRPGSMIKGTIVSIQDDVVLVAVGGKSEATMDRAEIEEEKVGDEVEGIVVETGLETRISRKLALGRRSLEQLKVAHESGLPVEGKVTGRNKGGYEVRLAGLRAFCPFSQMGLAPGEDQDSPLEKTFSFSVLELSENGRKIVLSRSALLRAEAEEKAAELLQKIQEGDVLPGIVRSVTKFGAFVDLGGLEGLVHVSEMSRARVTDPSDVVNPGDEVKVKVLKVEEEGRRISLSMKELEADPWDDVAARYAVGDEFTGSVVKVVDFGLFVEVEPGLQGLVHVSQLERGANLREERFAAGSTVSGFIRDVDPIKRRLALSLREVPAGDPWKGAPERYPVGAVVEGEVEKTAGFGVFLQIEPGLVGLLPVSEAELPVGSDPTRAFEPGQKLKVKVLSLDPKARRMSLSVRGALAEAERQEYGKYAQKAARRDDSGSSAFADALRQALKNPK